MEEQKDMFGLLDMMVQPVFCVKDQKIIRCNAAARQLIGDEGESVLPLLENSTEEYAAFTGGCLYLTLTLCGQPIGACIRRMENVDVFELDSDDSSALQAMALAARELRKPLAGALANAASLLDTQEDPEVVARLSKLNQGLYQMLRLLGNMSDAGYAASHCRMETADIPSVLRETFQKAQPLVEKAGITLTYQDLNETIYALADRAQLERAVLNILSNAAKFTPAGGQITASLTRRGRSLRLSVQDTGSGIAQEVMSSLFRRHLRQPGIEDSRFGLGLGIRMVHAAAIHHGGTLLISRGEEGGTRIVLTMAIRQKDANALSSPVFSVDYTGGFDHALVELADFLPAEFFDGSY